MESNSENMIEQQMQETRVSLAEKLETLEQKVVGTVENAASTVTETVDAIKETVHDTVASVQEGVKGSVDSVKDIFDIPAQVERRPWLMVGGAVAVGYVVGTMLPKGQSQDVGQPQRAAPVRAFPAVAEAPPAEPAKPSIWAPEIAKVKGLALGLLFGAARELLVSSLPEHLGEQLKEVMDNVTRKVGGEPLASSEWQELTDAISPSQTDAQTESESGNAPRKTVGNGHSGVRRW
jgi:ElaB/YqjD/DUF883 family membrane-anchored ribosome-binding protein